MENFLASGDFPHFSPISQPHPRVRCQSVVYFSGENFSFVAIIGIATHEGARK